MQTTCNSFCDCVSKNWNLCNSAYSDFCQVPFEMHAIPIKLFGRKSKKKKSKCFQSVTLEVQVF